MRTTPTSSAIEHQRHGVDAVAAVQLGVGGDLDLLDDDRALGAGVERHGLVPHAAAGLTGRRREHDHQPRGVGPGEVGPVELHRHVPGGPGRGRRLAALEQHRHHDGDGDQHQREDEALHRR